jgi:lipoprotein LpqB-like beta-propeller protein/sporulation and spore germination protein
MSSAVRRLRPLLAALALLLLVSGCVGLPSTGAVRTEPLREQLADDTPVDFTPGGPKPGAEPVEIVRGFLDAMRATPLNTSVARQYLTSESSASWLPEEGTVVYDAQAMILRSGNDVRLSLTDTVRLDGRGAWLGRSGDKTYDFDLEREGGQWRIDAPPDRLVIPTAHFETRFQQYFLYFFDKTSEVLVPEPVYVPTGAQATTFLANGLLAGPGQDMLGVERTYLPARTRLDDIAVVVNDGVADVPLTDDVLDLEPEELAKAFAQLSWTLRQVTGVQRMRVSVDGSPLDLPGHGTEVQVNAWSEYDPAVSWASSSLFGLRDGRVVTLIGGQERRVSGAFGSVDLGLRRIGVDLAGEEIAGATNDGRVLVAPRSRLPGTSPDTEDATTVLEGGTDLLAPAWDLHGILWLVDRTRSGARVLLVRDGATRTLDVPGLSGERVRSFILSRDGSRLVAVVSRDGRQELVVTRIERDDVGRVRGTTPVVPLRVPEVDGARIRDVAWRTPGTVAVLTTPSRGTSQVLLAKVDGSSTASEATSDAEVFHDRTSELVTSLVSGAPFLLGTPAGDLFALASNGRWTSSGIRAGLQSPTFVG